MNGERPPEQSRSGRATLRYALPFFGIGWMLMDWANGYPADWRILCLGILWWLANAIYDIVRFDGPRC